MQICVSAVSLYMTMYRFCGGRGTVFPHLPRGLPTPRGGMGPLPEAGGEQLRVCLTRLRVRGHSGGSQDRPVSYPPPHQPGYIIYEEPEARVE